MATYTKADESNRSTFCKSSFAKWDDFGRSVFYNFFKSTQKDWNVYCNDGRDQSKVDFTKTDLLAISPSGKKVNLEVEVKVKGFEHKYLKDGVHFTFRKIDNACRKSDLKGKDFIFGITNSDGSKLILVSGEHVYNAWKIWPEYCGYKNVQSTANFSMPDHKCFPVCKFTSRDSKKPEHFISIDWNKVRYYELKEDKWVKIQ